MWKPTLIVFVLGLTVHFAHLAAAEDEKPAAARVSTVLDEYPEQFFAGIYRKLDIEPKQVTIHPRGESVNRRSRWTLVHWELEMKGVSERQSLRFLDGVELLEPRVHAAGFSLSRSTRKEGGWNARFRVGHVIPDGSLEAPPLRSAHQIWRAVTARIRDLVELDGMIRIDRWRVTQKEASFEGQIAERGHIDRLVMEMKNLGIVDRVERDRTEIDPRTGWCRFGVRVFLKPTR